MVYILVYIRILFKKSVFKKDKIIAAVWVFFIKKNVEVSYKNQ